MKQTFVDKIKRQSSLFTVDATMNLMTILPVGESFYVECSHFAAQNFRKRWNTSHPKADLKIQQETKIAIDPATLEPNKLFKITILNRNDEK